jgi:hypothetical protein
MTRAEQLRTAKAKERAAKKAAGLVALTVYVKPDHRAAVRQAIDTLVDWLDREAQERMG